MEVTIINRTLAKKIIANNKEYLVWDDQTPISENEIVHEFYLNKTDEKSFLIHKETVFIISDIIL